MPLVRARGEWRRHPGIRSGVWLVVHLGPGGDVARQAAPAGIYPSGMRTGTPPIMPV